MGAHFAYTGPGKITMNRRLRCHGLSRRFFQVLAIAACMIVLTGAGIAMGSSDTTFGTTNLAPRPSGGGGTTSGTGPQNPQDSTVSGCFGHVLLGAMYVCVEGLVVKPVCAFFTCDAAQGFTSKKIQGGVGVSFLQFAVYPESRYSYGIKINGDLLYACSSRFVLREQLGGICYFAGDFFSDFQRSVYVNGWNVGSLTDHGAGYTEWRLPLMTELLYRPFGNNGSLYGIVGAGPEFTYGSMPALQSYSYNSSVNGVTITGWQLEPGFSIGIGKLIESGNGYGAVEIRYSLGINAFNRQVAMPFDNARFEHGITGLQYEIFF